MYAEQTTQLREQAAQLRAELEASNEEHTDGTDGTDGEENAR